MRINGSGKHGLTMVFLLFSIGNLFRLPTTIGLARLVPCILLECFLCVRYPFLGLLSFGFRVILRFFGTFGRFSLSGVCVLLIQLLQGFDDAFLGDIFRLACFRRHRCW